MVHIVVDGKHYVATEAAIRQHDHKMPAGTVYEVSTVLTVDNPVAEMNVLYDIAEAENRQWLRRMIVAGLTAGTAYAVVGYLVSFLPGGGP